MRVDQITEVDIILKNKVSVPRNKTIPTIHNVHILDASASMLGGKYFNAGKGINEELIELKKDITVNYTQTVIEFEGGNIKNLVFMQPINEVSEIKFVKTGGMTNLYQAVGETIERIIPLLKKEDKVIMTITTDGQENISQDKWHIVAGGAKLLKEVIENAKINHSFTVTFMGTDKDVEYMITNMGILRGNTLSHENTAASIDDVYKTRSIGMMSYSKGIQSGEFDTQHSSFFSKEIIEEAEKKLKNNLNF